MDEKAGKKGPPPPPPAVMQREVVMADPDDVAAAGRVFTGGEGGVATKVGGTGRMNTHVTE